jgi:hypothetical protein
MEPVPIDRDVRNWTALLLAAAMLAAASGCAGRASDKVERGVEHIRRSLERVKIDRMAGLAFCSTVESGGSVIDFFAANELPGSLPHLIWQGPPEPESIVIRPGEAQGEYVIEGYGERTDKPAVTEVVRGLKFSDR